MISRFRSRRFLHSRFYYTDPPSTDESTSPPPPLLSPLERLRLFASDAYDTASFHIRHRTSTAKLAVLVPVTCALMNTDVFLLSMASGVLIINAAVESRRHYALAMRRGLSHKVLHLMFPSIQQMVNTERAITSRAQYKLRGNSVIREQFGQRAWIDGPTKVDCVTVNGRDAIEVTYAVSGMSRMGEVSMTVYFYPVSLREAYDDRNTDDPSVGEMDNQPYKIRLKNVRLQMRNKLKTTALNLDDAVEDFEVVIDGV